MRFAFYPLFDIGKEFKLNILEVCVILKISISIGVVPKADKIYEIYFNMSGISIFICLSVNATHCRHAKPISF